MDSKFFVPLETAKQLKEKGYPQEFADWYYHESADKLAFVHNRYVPERVVTGKPTELGIWYIAAPTYHEVIDWLREQYGLIVCVGFSVARCWTWSVGRLRDILTLGAYGEKESTREEALNAAILEALEMI